MNDRELAQRVIEEVLSQPEFQPEKVGEFKFLQKSLGLLVKYCKR